MIPARTALVLLPLLAGACGGANRPSVRPDPDVSLPPSAERAYAAVASRFDRGAAMDVVVFMQQYWRIAGNPGFNASIDYIKRRLDQQGIRTEIDEFPKAEPGWDYSAGSVTIDGDRDPVLSRERDRVSLAINSFSRNDALPLVDVGSGASEKDYAGKNVKGAIVLGDAALGRLWQQAVRSRGAAGVISTEIARYIRSADPARMTETEKDVLQWGSIPHDAALRSFGFKASWRAAARLRAALAKNPSTRARVRIDSTFHQGPNRSLIAEIPGRSRAHQRIVMVAHIQEPGANDDASGCATLLGLASALRRAIAEGTLPPPERTLTFMWVDEIRGSRRWITSRPQAARDVQYMFSMDMTGEDTSKTGGTFLIEKQADPTAVWERPSDPHSEWGAGEVKAETLKGSLLNDVHLAIARRRARETGWVVRTNPYEGGSDHTAFASAGVPSVLNWHFTDRYYHTNQDTIDKVSADEMRHVGITVATSAYFLAAATASDATAVVDLLGEAATGRLALEARQGAGLVATARDRAAAEKIETNVRTAWIKWYREALDSVERLPVEGAAADLRRRIAAGKQRVR